MFWSCGIQAGCDALLLVDITMLHLIILRARFWLGLYYQEDDWA